MKVGVRAVSSNNVAGQAKPETVRTTPVKAWVSIPKMSPKGSSCVGRDFLLTANKQGAIVTVFLGDYGGVAPPVPIPNTEVKRLYADDTALATRWDNMASPRD